MTNTLTLRSFDIPSIHKFGVGFDTMFDELMKISNQQGNQNYPPYNVVKHDENKFAIEVAISGFREGDVAITVDNNVLTIEGAQSQNLDDVTKEYLHRGISARNFQRNFTLADHVEVVGAEVAHGILTVTLERRIPEELQPKKIAITFNK